MRVFTYLTLGRNPYSQPVTSGCEKVSTYNVDSSWWRYQSAQGDTVSAGSPLKVFRFSSAAREILETLEKGDELPASASTVITRLVAAGAIHPQLTLTQQVVLHATDVTVVIPAHNESVDHLRALVTSLSGVGKVIIVDDGSTPPIANIEGAQLIRRETCGGPAAARNTALATVTSEIVFFLDADVSLSMMQRPWADLLFHFDDPLIGLVAPRVASQQGPSILQRYEDAESPLDLGEEPARVSQGTRVSYVPSAAMMVRTALVREHNGFDETMRYGEDVDLVWRLSNAGVICRYEPSVIVHHAPRQSFAHAWRQRVSYGSAAAQLDAHHPGAVAPLRINRWSALAWGALGFGHPVIAVCIATGSTGALFKKIAGHKDSPSLALHLAGKGNIYAGRTIASAMTRSWWPLSVLAALFLRRSRHAVVAAIILPSVWSWWKKKPKLDPLTYCTLRLADDVAYGTGVWKGVIARRNIGALKPRFD